MNTSVTIALDYRVMRKDGTHPIVLRITHHRKIGQFALGYHVIPTDWDDGKRKVKSSSKAFESVNRINHVLLQKKAAAIDAIAKLDEQKKLYAMNVADVLQHLKHASVPVLFAQYTQTLIERMQKEKKIGNARTYKSVLSALTNHCNGRSIAFGDITYQFLRNWETDHLSRGNSYNGLSVYFRTIRAVFNKAIKENVIEKELYPFDQYSIKSNSTRKLAISLQAIQRIEAEELMESDPLFLTKQLFLFSFYTRGMSFADIAHLKVENLINDRIYYARQKTDKPYNIRISPQLQAILNFYISRKMPYDYVFPIIKRSDPQEQYKDVEWARNRYNKRLQKLAERCEIHVPITSKTSRHSFASRAKNIGIPIANISELLGHASTKTTEVYLADLPAETLDAITENIVSLTQSTDNLSGKKVRKKVVR